MNKRCLICLNPTVDDSEYHAKCARSFFGVSTAPALELTLETVQQYAAQSIIARATITGVQKKLSLGLEGTGKETRLTVVGLWGNFILKPPNDDYPFLPENEDTVMRIASMLNIPVVPHAMIRLASGELSYITRRIDRDTSNGKIPELYKRVEVLSAKAGLRKVPDVYLMQAGGALNAMATKFLKSHMIILFTDLLDACADNNNARDMIIGHEIGHLKEGHLDWYWFILPGMFVPILGQAYSRAREYTCDRYGYELCDNKESGIKGLVILSAGGKFAGNVKMSTFINQKRDLDTAWMTLGRLFSSYPPIVDRITALDKTIPGAELTYSRGPMQAVLLLFVIFILPFGAMIFGFSKISSLIKHKTGLS
ncbi:MAG TPA: M48 family metalloprotease, partial [Chitinispirillaceae bacterium]|nr:M48 family metalloprotease [Chitinispirillaceae bacterium]